MISASTFMLSGLPTWTRSGVRIGRIAEAQHAANARLPRARNQARGAGIVRRHYRDATW